MASSICVYSPHHGRCALIANQLAGLEAYCVELCDFGESSSDMGVIRPCICLALVLWTSVCVVQKISLPLNMKPNAEKPKPKHMSDLKASKIKVQWRLFSQIHSLFWVGKGPTIQFNSLVNGLYRDWTHNLGVMCWIHHQRERLKICNILVIRLATLMPLLELAFAVCLSFSGPKASALIRVAEAFWLLWCPVSFWKGQSKSVTPEMGCLGERRMLLFSFAPLLLWKAMGKSCPCSNL